MKLNLSNPRHRQVLLLCVDSVAASVLYFVVMITLYDGRIFASPAPGVDYEVQVGSTNTALVCLIAIAVFVLIPRVVYILLVFYVKIKFVAISDAKRWKALLEVSLVFVMLYGYIFFDGRVYGYRGGYRTLRDTMSPFVGVGVALCFAVIGFVVELAVRRTARYLGSCLRPES